MVSFKSLAIIAIGMTSMLEPAVAHPGEHLSSLQVKRQAEHAQALAARAATKLARCADSPKARSLRERAATRRATKYAALRKRALKRGATESAEYDAATHNYTGIIDKDQAFTVNTSCILEPQVTIGPYWVEGELIREDNTDGEEGVPMQLELEFLDVNTCEPVSGLYIDIWHANATGYYSGIAESGVDTTFLRGIQITDDDGVATFDTLVAGHYEGRAVHTHLMVHQNVTEYANGTYTGGTVRSISQLFYQSTLQEAVEATAPYSSNTNSITANTEDSILNSITDESYDPFLNYIYLGSDISDGIFAYHSIGIDLTANYTSNESAAAHYYESGGVVNSNSGFGGGAGGAPPGAGGNMTGGPSGGPGASGSSGAVPSGTFRGSAQGTAFGTASGSSSTVVVNAATAVGTSSISSATSNSGAQGTRGGFFHSIGIFTRSAQAPGKKPTDLPGGRAQHSGEYDGKDSARVSNSADLSGLPTEVPSYAGHNKDNAGTRQSSFGSCS